MAQGPDGVLVEVLGQERPDFGGQGGGMGIG